MNNMQFIRKLPIPMEVKAQYPLPGEAAAVKAKRDEEIKAVFNGKSGKFLLIVGPCSADSEKSVLDYVSRLASVQEKIKDKIIMIPRVYTCKPRSGGGAAYMGMMHQPDPHNKPDMLKGIIAVRSLHLSVLTQTGLSAADEMLYPENHRYINDLLSYVAVGARSVEDQHHRLTASGLSVPVGMKNPPSGDIGALTNAVAAAQCGHDFIYRGWEVKSLGNLHAHAILRGYTDRLGRMTSNCGEDDLRGLFEEFCKKQIKNPSVIVDTNHANSGKDFSRQPEIALGVMNVRRKDAGLRRFVKGLMIESYIEDGCQAIGGSVYGRSITDPCLGWEKTERLIYEIAELL